MARPTVIWLGVASVCFSLLAPARAIAQAVVHPGAPVCGRCRIELRRIARLGDDDGDGSFPGYPSSVVQDSRGRFLVAMHQPANEPPWIFSRNGHFLQRLGRSGEGPGEYRGARVLLVSAGDTLRVFDGVLARQTVIGPGYHVVRTTPSPRNLEAAIQLRGGDLVVNANVADAQRIGLTYHIFHPDGSYLRSIGEPGIQVSPFEPVTTTRWLAPASDGGFWAVPWAYHYRVEHWTRRLTLDRIIEPRASWYAPYDSIQAPTPARPPQATLFGVWEDSASGLLWVLGQAADLEWRRALGKPRKIEGATIYPVEVRQQAYDSILEVYDVRSATLLARARLPYTLELVVRPGVVAGVREDDIGRLFVEVWEVTLRR